MKVTKYCSDLLHWFCAVILITITFPSFGNCVTKRFYVEKYGNDKQAFARLSADVNANRGGRVVFPRGVVYEINVEDDFNGGHSAFPQSSSIIFDFRNCENVSVDMNGSSIIVNPNHSTKYSVFFFYNCKSFLLNNGILVGDAKTHDYSSVIFRGKEEKSSHEWGHGINVTGSRGTIRNMSISYMTGDGMRFSSYRNKTDVFHAKVEVDNTEICHCRRNGITVGSSEGLLLSNTTIHHIGTYDGVVGTLPQAGIDLEYEDKVEDDGAVVITDCHIFQCTTATLTASNTSPPCPSQFVVSNSMFEGSYFQISNMKMRESGRKLLKECRFLNACINCGEAIVEDCLIELGAKIHYVHGTTFRNCSFIGQVTESNSKYGSCIVGNNYSLATFEKCTFKDIRGKNDNSIYQGFSGYLFKLNASFEDCEFINCSFAQGGAGAESNFTFKNCTLKERCMIYNRSENLVTFTGSKLDNVASYVNQKGRFSFEKCEIIQDDQTVQYPLLYFGKHLVKDCTIIDKIVVTDIMKQRGVKAAQIEIIK